MAPMPAARRRTPGRASVESISNDLAVDGGGWMLARR
jgi:hypothetical protein